MRTLDKIYYDIDKENKMAKTWKDRLAKESKKLRERTNKLTSYIENEDSGFRELDEADKDLLITQHATMVAYENILAMRMKRAGILKTKCRKKNKIEAADFDEFLDMLSNLDKPDIGDENVTK